MILNILWLFSDYIPWIIIASVFILPFIGICIIIRLSTSWFSRIEAFLNTTNNLRQTFQGRNQQQNTNPLQQQRVNRPLNTDYPTEPQRNQNQQNTATQPNQGNQSQGINMNVYNQRECSICLQAMRNTAAFNCNHLFCVGCTHSLIERTNRNTKLNCPLCRRAVSMIVTNINQANQNTRRHSAKIDAYNNQFSENQGAWSLVRDRQFIFRTIRALMSRRGIFQLLMLARSNPCTLSWLFFLIIYIISPIDLLPEAILGPIGLIDDAGAVFLAMGVVSKLVHRLFTSVRRRH